jgi:hypothetical protein
MKQTINLHQFRNAFKDMNRENQFSYEGLALLFDALEDFEQNTGEDMELDVIELCCDFSEDSAENIAATYNISIDESLPLFEQVVDHLLLNTWVCGFNEDKNIIVYQSY